MTLCHICYNEMYINIKELRCINSHAVCSSCFFKSYSNKCSFCRRPMGIIEINYKDTPISITNSISSKFLLYFALLQEQYNGTSWQQKMKYLDPDYYYTEVREILSPKYKLYKINFGINLFQIAIWITLNNISIYGVLYCPNKFNCFVADYYYSYLMIKVLIIISLFLQAVYIYDKTYYINNNYYIFKNLKKFNKIRN
jgi:hypothetical protein